MKQMNLLEAPVGKAFRSYLIPSVSATLVTSIYILADTVMIGRGIGAEGMAALNILLPLYSVFYGLGMMCGVGGSVLFCFSKGKSDERAARSYFTTALCLCLFFAAAAFLICRLFFDPILELLGNTKTMAVYAIPYGKVFMSAAPVFVFSSFLQAFVRNDGAPRLAMAGVIAGGVTNVVLDYVYIYLAGWGMAGAALATVTGTGLTILILSTHFFSKENHLKLTSAVDRKRAAEIMGSGLASFILEISSGFVMFLFNRRLLVCVGEIGVVVYGIISNTALVVNSISNGIAQAVQPLLATNFGAGNMERVDQARKLGLRVAVTAGICFAAIGELFPVGLSHLFLDPSAEVLAMAVPAIRLYAVAFLASEWNIMCGTYFQSIVKPKYSLLITLLRGVILNSVLVFGLSAAFGVKGIWVTVTVSEFITAAAAWKIMKKQPGKS